MARLKRFELLTHCLEGSCSIQLSYRRTGRGSKIRTYDHSLPKRVRYQTAPYPVCFSEGANILHTFYTSFFECKVEVSKASSSKKKVIICYLTVASTVFFKFGIFRLSMFPSLDSSLISFSKSLLTFVNPI